MTKADLVDKVAALGASQAWNHNITLPEGVQTRPEEQVSHGKNLVKWERIEPLLRTFGLSDKRVLDLGCNEGFFSLKAAEMGADVTGIDIDPLRIEKALFVQQVLGATRARFDVVDIYSRAFTDLPPFDLCVCMGFLHRIPDPVLALTRLSQKSDTILLEWKCLKFGPHDEPFAYFTPAGLDGTPRHETQYWLMSIACVTAILRTCGYSYFRAIDDSRFKRAILVAGKGPNAVFDEPDQVVHRRRFRVLAAHTKRYVSTVGKILTGRLNA